MEIRLHDGLPFVTATLAHQGREVTLKNVLLDTGSAGSVFATDAVLGLGLRYEPEDTIRRIRGVGGTEFVFMKRVGRLSLGELRADDFEVEAGAMDYGFPFDGIIGMAFLLHVGAVVDLGLRELRAANGGPPV